MTHRTIPRPFHALLTLLIGLGLFFSGQSGRAQSGEDIGLPVITLHEPQMDRSGFQFWSAVQDWRGILLFGSNQGILNYDGVHWDGTNVPSQTVIRSLALGLDGRVFWGGRGDFGYLKPDEKGLLQSVSFLDKLPPESRAFTDVWHIACNKDGVYFFSQEGIYRFDGQAMQAIPARFQRWNVCSLSGALLFMEAEKGLCRLIQDRIQPLLPKAGLAKGGAAITLLPGKKLLMAWRTAPWEVLDLAPFFLNSAESFQTSAPTGQPAISPFSGPVESFLKKLKESPYVIYPLSEGRYAVSTNNSGIVLFDQDGRVVRWLHKKTGLPDNTVFYVYPAPRGNLWACTNNGLAFVEAGSPSSYFDEKNHLEGMPRAMEKFNGQLYVGTFKGLYVLTQNPLGENEFQIVPGGPRQILAMKVVSGELLITGGENGLAHLDKGRAVNIHPGKYAYSMGVTRRFPGHVFVAMDNGLHVFRKQAEWQRLGTIPGIRNALFKMTEDDQGDLWITSDVNGIYRLHFTDKDPLRCQVYHYGPEQGLPTKAWLYVQNFDHRLLVGTEKGLFQAAGLEGPPDKVRFLLDDRIPINLPPMGFGDLCVDPLGHLWIVSAKCTMRCRKVGNAYVIDDTAQKRIPYPTSHLFVDKLGVCWVPSRTLHRYDPSVHQNYDLPYSAVIKSVVVARKQPLFLGALPSSPSHPNLSLDRKQPKNGIPALPYRLNAMDFSFAAPCFESLESNRYRFILEGFDAQWSDWTRETRKEYTGLPEGRYCFKVKAINIFEKESTTAEYRFEIRPPWYRTWWAYSLYVAGFLGLLWVLVQWRLKKLRTERDALEDKVRERTLELQESLVHLEASRESEKSARLAAEAATRSKSEFLANMSHELRTPMNAIIGFSTLMLKMDLPLKLRDYSQKICSSAQSLLGIINDILDFSKIEAGKLSTESIPFELSDVLTNVGDLFSLKASEKGMEFIISSAPDVPGALVGDPLRLGQVLINLVNNAIKFTPQGFVHLRVERDPAGTDEGGKALLSFRIQDSGIGMTPEQLSRLFQAFSQADTSTTRKYGGTGLGLTISKKLVEMMGGTIGVTSEAGKGSCFYFSLELPLQSSPPAAEIIKAGKPFKVLVVDDSSVAREVLTEQLVALRFEVTAVSSGEQALEALQDSSYSFDLVLMDYQMPGMDGIETLRCLKSQGQNTKVPSVVMISAFGREEIMGQAQRAGVKGFLIKPVNPSLLFDTLMEVLAGQDVVPMTPLSSREKPSQDEESVRGIHLLLAEDNEINQQVAVELLKTVGVSVDIAKNGQEAVEMVDRASYDAVLMDVQMPGMDGYMATQVIREKALHQNLPIIAMTAHALAGYREECLLAGMNDYVTKPIDPDQLFKVLAKWVQAPQKPIEKPWPEESALSFAIPGIDSGMALYRLAGNQELFIKLLQSFRQEFENSVAELEACLEREDWDAAANFLHTLRGAAGSLAAGELHKHALRWEEALRSHNLSQSRLLQPAFQLALDEVLGGIRQLPLAMAPRFPNGQSKESNAMIFEGSVLLADDNLANRKVAESMLAKHGLKVLTVEDGLAAVEQMEKATFDVVFLDGHMPRLDGPATLTEIRLRESGVWMGQHHYVVALTGLTAPGDRKRLLNLGFDDYLAKPLEERALQEVLKHCFKPVRVVAASAQTAEDRLEAFAQALGGREELLEFLAVFIQDSEDRRIKMRQALEAGDRLRLSREAHDLKSNAATLGFSTLASLCQSIERQAPELGENEIECGLVKIAQEMEEARAACLEYSNRRSE